LPPAELVSSFTADYCIRFSDRASALLEIAATPVENIGMKGHKDAGESRFPRHADERTALGTLKNGAYHFLQKPFQEAQLLDFIRQVTRHKYGAAALKHSSRY
jgi:hypothetical protein